jgi:hypothetical protein
MKTIQDRVYYDISQLIHANIRNKLEDDIIFNTDSMVDIKISSELPIYISRGLPSPSIKRSFEKFL